MNKKNLLKLAKFLDTLPPEKFDFSSIVGKYNKRNKCGTVCCAIGWTPKLFPNKVYWGLFGGIEPIVKIKNYRNYKVYPTLYEIARELFDINLVESSGLFIGGSTRPWVSGDDLYSAQYLTEYATPQEVAFNIRHFIKWKEMGSPLGGIPRYTV